MAKKSDSGKKSSVTAGSAKNTAAPVAKSPKKSGNKAADAAPAQPIPAPAAKSDPETAPRTATPSARKTTKAIPIASSVPLPSAVSKKPKKEAAAKKTSSPVASNRANQVEAAPAGTISHDAIALRAYFIAENRRQLGIPGDEQGNWIEAERQLRADLQSAKPGKKSAAKKAITL